MMIKHVKDKTIISLNPKEYYQLKEVLIDEDKECFRQKNKGNRKT